MSVYLLPLATDPTEICEILQRSGLELFQFETIRDFIQKTSDSGPVIIGTMRPQDLLVLNRHATTLVTELPSIVMSAPGVVYTGDWVATASALPAIDWRELKDKLSKSGHTAFTPESLEKRGQGGEPFDTHGVSRRLFRRTDTFDQPTAPAEDLSADDLPS